MSRSAAPRTYRAEAVVLKGFDVGEADRILTLVTPTHGKVRAVAKGVRKTRSHMGGHVDLFMRCSLLLAHGRQLDIVTQAETLDTYGPLRTDLWRSSLAHYVAELVERFSVDEAPNAPMYALTTQTLAALAAEDNPVMVVRAFEVRLLGIAGYRPQLYRCLHCESAIAPGANRFSVKLGGVLCPLCHCADGGAIGISNDALKLFRNLQTNEAAVLRLKSIPSGVAAELEQVLQAYLIYRLESRPRSIAVLHRLQADMEST